MAKKKKRPEETEIVRFEMHKPFEPPHEGEYYQLLVYRPSDLGFYSMIGYGKESSWHVQKEAADILDLVEEHDKQRKTYAKVQIRKVNREVIVGAE